ncbi:MAG: alpha/beta fold hydrolase [Gemmatimonadaceae bacterium]|nr:alpha/beta fold hydrolase [Gemmatimonadaceae bacterium]
MTTRSVWRASVTSALTAMLASTAALAQQRIGLIHGFNSSGSTWQLTEQRLVQEFGSRIQVYRPNLPDNSTYEAQGVVLAYNTAGWPNGGIFVGHSNGGIASRMASRYAPATHRGIVTVGTPHGGAPLFGNAGAVAGLVMQTGVELAHPISHFNTILGGADNQTTLVWIEALTYTGLLAQATSFVVDGFLGLMSGELRTQMAPGSAFNANLNHDTTLTREAAEMPQGRFGIMSVVPQIGGYLCGLWASQSSCAYAQYALADLYEATYWYYLLYSNPQNAAMEYQAHYFAFEWMYGTMALWHLDEVYCGLYTGVPYSCVGDSVVGLEKAMYPGVPQRVVNNGPNHFGETASLEVHERIAELFRAGAPLAIP